MFAGNSLLRDETVKSKNLLEDQYGVQRSTASQVVGHHPHLYLPGILRSDANSADEDVILP